MNGEIFAMAGASTIAHNHLAANVLTHLRTALRGGQCSAFGSDLRLATPGGLYTYPDVMVICGSPAVVPGRPDTVTDPTLLVEVLSEATRDYDRGEKLLACQTIPTLHDVLLIEQATVRVGRVHRTAPGTWARDEATRLDAVVQLASVGVAMSLAEVYREKCSASRAAKGIVPTKARVDGTGSYPTFACKPKVQMSGFSKVEMSARSPHWGDGGHGWADDGGTGSPTGHDGMRRRPAEVVARLQRQFMRAFCRLEVIAARGLPVATVEPEARRHDVRKE